MLSIRGRVVQSLIKLKLAQARVSDNFDLSFVTFW